MPNDVGDEASDVKKRDEFAVAARSQQLFATHDSTTNDDSEKGGGGGFGENKRPEHEVWLWVWEQVRYLRRHVYTRREQYRPTHLSFHRSDV